MSWKDTVKDPEAIKVFMALDGRNDTWRTTSGIARQTGLPESRVREILKKYDSDLICFSDVPSITGMPLVGLLEKVG